MERPYVDLHIHSIYSDGTMSPDEIVETAISNGVGVLAVADHNTSDGSIETQKLCKERGIHCVPAVEIDALDGGANFHILAYGFDVNDQQFVDFIKHTRFLLDEQSVKLIERMQVDYPSLSLAEFMEFSHDRRLGGWKSIHYFKDKGLVSSLKDGMKFYSEYGIEFKESGFSTIAAVVYRIKRAGGYAVLAHPSVVIDSSDISKFKQELKRIVSFGIDGIECYYPSHSAAVTEACLKVCNELDLMITAGSDCHGNFWGSKGPVGIMQIMMDKLRIEKLI